MSLRVDLTGTKSGFSQMLSSAKTEVKAFSDSVGKQTTESWSEIGKNFAASLAGAIGFEAIKSRFEWFVDTGKEIKEQAEQINMSTDAWQKWNEAVNAAGLSTGRFKTMVEALQSKRTEALTDPKARAQLSKLGFSDEEITDTDKYDTDYFTKKALENANKGPYQRQQLQEVMGQKAPAYASALGKYDSATPLFSAEDIKEAEALSEAMRNLTKFLNEATISLIHLVTGQKKDWATLIGGVGGFVDKYLLSWDWGNKKKGVVAGAEQAQIDADYKPVHALTKDERDKAAADRAAAAAASAAQPDSTAVPSKDPFDAALAAQKEEMALHEQERQQTLAESQRSLMTIGDRRASIQSELSKLLPQISQRNSKMNGEDFLNDNQRSELNGVTGKAREFAVNKYRSTYQDETDKLQLRANKDRGDLKEKPLAVQHDSMSKVGLYSASALAFNPALGIAQKQLTVLEKIAANTSPRSGVSKPVYDSFGDKKGLVKAGSGSLPGGATGFGDSGSYNASVDKVLKEE